jgi:carbonic anhydrase
MEPAKTNCFYLACLMIMLCSCGGSHTPDANTSDTTATSKDTIVIDAAEVLENPVLTQEQQRALTPQKVLDLLKEGNDDFVNDRLTIRNSAERIRKAALGQYPKAVILSCVDSRVPVEDVFHRGIGDIFVGRIAGNVVNPDMLGSMEFGCKVSGAKLILVLGHEHCGAIKSAIDDVKLGNITALLARIRPAVTSLSFNGDKSSKNDAFVHAVCEQNVKLTVENIRKNSPILAEMEKKGEIMILGGVYDMNSGKVAFF